MRGNSRGARPLALLAVLDRAAKVPRSSRFSRLARALRERTRLLLRQLKGLICIREGRALSRPSYVAATERGPPNESTPFVAVSIASACGAV